MDELRHRFWGRSRPRARPPLAAAPTGGETQDGTATLRLYGPVDSWGGEWGCSDEEFAAALDALPEGTERIRLHINSGGGEVFQGIAIANALRRHPAHVTTVVDGLAASIASVIALAGDEVVMARNSELMVHQPWGVCIGDAADMRKLAETLEHLAGNLAGAYAAKAGGTLDGWLEAMAAETWFSADEAVTAGLADRVEGVAADVPVAAAFDLSGFRYAGRMAAPAPRPAAQRQQTEERDNRQQVRHRMNERRFTAA